MPEAEPRPAGGRRLRGIAAVLLAAAGLGAAAGALAGTFLGRRYLPSFGWMLADSAAEAALWTGLGLAASAAVWSALAPLLGRWRWGAQAAALAVAAPWIALAGLRLNRIWGLRPADLLAGTGLGRNVALAAGGALLAVLAARLLGRVRRDGLARRLAAAGALSAALAAVGWAAVQRASSTAAAAAEGSRPHIFVLLIDALRADHLSSYGYPRATTPALDRLAADGIVFDDSIAASTFTKSSIASLFTGRYPYQHGVYWGSRRLADGSVVADRLPGSETTLAEAFASRGWLTEAWVQNSHLGPDMGFAQGFVDYRANQGSIERIHRRVERFLDGPALRYPLFAYLHYIDLHDPYRPRQPYDSMFGTGEDPYAGIDLDEWGGYLEAVRRGEVTLDRGRIDRLRDLYDGQLRFIDDAIGRFLDDLRRRGLYDDSLIVVTSDHGEGFYEHGFIAHSTVPYEELIRVPLIVKWPQNRWAGRRVDQPVRSVDLMPTLLAAAGGTPPEGLAGCNLLGVLRGGDAPASCGVATVEIAEDGAYPVVAVRSRDWKYIHHEKRPDEVFDLTADPGEQNDLGEAVAGEVAEVGELRLRALGAVASRAALGEDRVELSEEEIRQLKGLGYLK